jgi:hypothetical protein
LRPKRIITSGAANRMPPASKVVVRPPALKVRLPPPIKARMIGIGIAVKIRKNVVRRLSSRSG